MAATAKIEKKIHPQAHVSVKAEPHPAPARPKHNLSKSTFTKCEGKKCPDKGKAPGQLTCVKMFMECSDLMLKRAAELKVENAAKAKATKAAAAAKVSEIIKSVKKAKAEATAKAAKAAKAEAAAKAAKLYVLNESQKKAIEDFKKKYPDLEGTDKSLIVKLRIKKVELKTREHFVKFKEDNPELIDAINLASTLTGVPRVRLHTHIKMESEYKIDNSHSGTKGLGNFNIADKTTESPHGRTWAEATGATPKPKDTCFKTCWSSLFGKKETPVPGSSAVGDVLAVACRMRQVEALVDKIYKGRNLTVDQKERILRIYYSHGTAGATKKTEEYLAGKRPDFLNGYMQAQAIYKK